jgi:hypothetical protein
MFDGRVHESLESADRALAMARAWERNDVTIMSLHIRGDARCSLGDPGGLDDLREALRLAREWGNASDIVTSSDYLAEWLSAIEGPAAAIPQYEEGIAVAERRGVVSQGQWTKAGSLAALFELGRWEDLERRCRELLGVGPGLLDESVASAAGSALARVHVLRGERQRLGSADRLLAQARPIGELQVLAPALVVAGLLAWSEGEREAAAGSVREFAEITGEAAPEYRQSQLAEVVRVALWAGEGELAAEMASHGEARNVRGRLNVLSARAEVAEARGDAAGAAATYDEAVRGWRDYGHPWEEAHALLGRARCATDDAAAAADRARADELFASLRARPLPR